LSPTKPAMDYKPAIIDALTTLEQSDTARGERFAAAAYKKVLGQIKTLPAVHGFEDLAAIKGIGAKMRIKFQEIFETGKLASAEHAKANPEFIAYNELLKVYGIGPVKAKQFVESGVCSVEAMKALAAENPKALTDAQKLGLQYYYDGLERIPRAEIDEHKVVLERAFSAEGLCMEIVGSYRRGAVDSGDIDVLVTAGPGMTKTKMIAAFKRAVDALDAADYLLGILARGPSKTLAYSAVPSVGKGRRLDLLLTAPEEYPYAIVYFTGSDQFNIAMRRWALDQGYTMNEHTMTPTAEGTPAPPPMRDERDIFEYLGLAWVPPTERKDGSQVVAVAAAASAAAPEPKPSAAEMLRNLKAKRAAALAKKNN
jgi:DNA polymerase/3'-5' exonuclease PolX